MGCEETPLLACRLDEMIEIMTGFDWNAFAAALLATLFGAAVALAGSFLIAHLDRVQQDSRRLDEALTAFGMEVIAYRNDLDRYRRECARWAPAEWDELLREGMPNEERLRRVKEPSSTRMLDSLALAQLVARGKSRATLRVLAGTVHELAEHRGGRFRRQVVETVLPGLAKWRSGEQSSASFEMELRNSSSGR